MTDRPARDLELRRRDARARRLAQSGFERPLVLEAGAGSGKTTALVARVVAWSLGAGWERVQGASDASQTYRIARRVLSGVVAITFTEAAAAEMGTRVGDALREVEQGSLPLGLLSEALPVSGDARRERARALRGALDHLVATTIHAWCRRLLVAHPLDAGLHARLEVDADGRVRREIVREVLDTRLREGYAAGDAELLALAERGVGPREIEAEVLELLEAGLAARTFAEDPFAGERVAALAERLRRAAEGVREAGAPLGDLAGAPTSAETFACVARLAERLRARALASRTDLAHLAEWLAGSFGEAELGRLGRWGASRLGAREAAALRDRAPRLVEAAGDLLGLVRHVRQIDVERLELGRAVFGELLAEVEHVLRARGVATFHQLIDGASRLLTGDSRVAAGVRAQIDQLLVDEFQDTDRRQCDLLRAVALEGPPSSRPGLFVVGDPKQSIYGWRSADLTAYDAFVEDVLTAGGRREVLYVNYRSVPAVLDEVERVVAPVMLERPGVQPGFEPLVASEANADKSGFADEGHTPVEYWVSASWDAEAAGRKTSASEASRLEARALARELRSLHDELGVRWASFGVLFRSRGDWDVYLAALRERHIPFAVEGDRSYYRRREIVDAAGLVRCVLDPNDQLALLTLLRSAVVGVPDAALIPLWGRDLPRRLAALHGPDPERIAAIRACVAEAAEALPDDVPGLERVAGWERSLVALAAVLGELRRSAREDAVDLFVEKLRTSLLLEASEAARFQGAWRAANLDRFFRDLLADLEDGGDFHRVLRRLRAAVGEERDAEEGRPKEILEDAVQILTIHGAKGLDFDHVYLMQLHKGAPPVRQAQVEVRAVGGDLEYRVLGAPTPGWDRAERERVAVEEAERVRTLYVAMTRARERVVLAGLWPDFAHGASGRTIDLVAKALVGSAPKAALGECAARGAHDLVDDAGARWVFTALAPPEPEPPRASREVVALPDESAVAAASAQLRQARAAMTQRMARPLGAAASEDPHENPEDRAERGWGRAGAAAFAGRGESVAAVVGTALHRALEAFDFGSEPRAELERARAIAARVLRAQLPAQQQSEGLERVAALLECLEAGPLLERLWALAPHIVARELPVLVAAGEGDAAVGYVSGALDLVYTDPESGRLVVADYKTGARRDYSRQGAQYRRALREALELAYEPRFELWYLEEGAIVSA